MSRDQMFLTAKFSLLRQKARLLDQTMQCDQMFLTQQMRDLLCNMTVAADRYGTDAISLAHVLYFHGDKLSREAFGRNVRELGEAINLLAKEYKALQELLSAPHIALTSDQLMNLPRFFTRDLDGNLEVVT